MLKGSDPIRGVAPRVPRLPGNGFHPCSSPFPARRRSRRKGRWWVLVDLAPPAFTLKRKNGQSAHFACFRTPSLPQVAGRTPLPILISPAAQGPPEECSHKNRPSRAQSGCPAFPADWRTLQIFVQQHQAVRDGCKTNLVGLRARNQSARPAPSRRTSRPQRSAMPNLTVDSRPIHHRGESCRASKHDEALARHRRSRSLKDAAISFVERRQFSGQRWAITGLRKPYDASNTSSGLDHGGGRGPAHGTQRPGRPPGTNNPSRPQPASGPGGTD